MTLLVLEGRGYMQIVVKIEYKGPIVSRYCRASGKIKVQARRPCRGGARTLYRVLPPPPPLACFGARQRQSLARSTPEARR